MQLWRRPWLALGFLALASPVLAADDPAVEGSVTDAVTEQPLRDARVRAGDREARTDASGRFRVERPPAGLALEVAAPGYVTLSIPADVLASHERIDAALVPERFHEEVEVRASPVPREQPSTEAVGPERVLQAAGALDNVFRLLRTLPGVTATEEVSSRLSVRGGEPDQNLTVMDGVEIHNPYRLFGLTSAFNPETVERFELTAGGFDVRHGDRLSSLLVVENRAGNAARPFGGSATVGLTDTNLVTEGRLPGGASGSWLLTARRTYYDLVAERFTDGNLPGFFDVQAHGRWSVTPRHRLSLEALRSRESSEASVKGYFEGEGADFLSRDRSDLAALSLDSTLGRAGQLTTTVAWSRNADAVALSGHVDSGLRRSNAPDDGGVRLEHADFDRDFGVRDLSLRQELAWSLSPRHFLQGGYEAHGLRNRIAFWIRGDRNPLASNGTSVLGGAGLPDSLDSRTGSGRAGAWLQDRVTLSHALTAEAGLRLDRSRLTGEASWQPRFSLALDRGSAGRWRAAAGAYAQSPGYEKLYQSDYFLDLTGARARGLRNERALHALLGYERTLGAGFTARLEGYYRRFDRLVLGQLESDAERARRLARYDFPEELRSSLPVDPVVTTAPDNSGRGRSYGFDAYVARDAAVPDARLTGWLSYTYGVAARTAYGRTYAFEYDRRHAVSLVGRVRLGAKLELAVTGRAATGFPRTPPLGLRVASVADGEDRDGDGDLAEWVPERDAEGRLVYQPDYGGTGNFGTARLPLFARLDARASFRPKGRSGRWEYYVDVINVFDRRNAELLRPELEYDPESDRPRLLEHASGSIGILPSLGVRWRF
jgi:hypothetical protein